MRKAEAGQVGPREFANVAFGAASCGRNGMLRLLVAAMARAAQGRLGEFNPQHFANTVWAFATVNYRDEKLFAALATAAEWRLSEFNSQEPTNTAWAFATVTYRDEQLFAALAIAAERRLSEFSPQNAANTA